MRNMSDKELQLHIRAVILLVLSMTAIAMMGMVARQNWDSKVTAYPTKTEAAIHDYANQMLMEMTLEEKVAQMMFAAEISDGELAADMELGGVLLGDANLGDMGPGEVSAVVSGFRTGAEIPLFIGANEEGGKYNTLSKYPSIRSIAYLSPGELVTTGGMGLVESDTEDKCEFLRSMGVNVNFAPVCDVATKEGAYMYGRALGKDADDTARYVETVVEEMNDEDIIGVLKHFPGYGNLSASHGNRVFTDLRTMEELESGDLLPFAAGMKAGAKMVMMGHSVVTAMDGEAPASLSRKAYTYLRRSYDFDGVVMTDALNAEGLGRYGDPAALAVSAVQAGADMLLTTDYETQIPAVMQAVLAGEISRERIDESVLRILKLKIETGILR